MKRPERALLIAAVLTMSVLGNRLKISAQTLINQSEFVVRFAEGEKPDEAEFPEGTIINSIHDPMNIVTLQNPRLDKDVMLALLKKMEHIERVEFSTLDEAGNPVYPTGFALLKLNTGIEKAQSYCKSINATILRQMDALGWIAVKIPGDIAFDTFAALALKSGNFNETARDEIILADQHVPNDPLYGGCWFINQINDKDIDADLAWNMMPSNSIAKNVAVLDGHGFDVNHSDLVGRWAGTYNAVNQSTDVNPVSAFEKHATACAGIIGANYNNGIGSSGLGFNLIKVLAIQIGYNAQSSGSFYTSSLIQIDAINYAMANNNTVAISMSFGSSSYQSSFYSALTSARTIGRDGKGIVIFGSSGNNGSNNWVNYPASYSGVIAVGSTMSTDTKSSYSNFGTGLAFAAPGTSITTTDVTGANGYSSGDYTNFSGTSAACPVAASVGALTMIANPTLTEVQVKQILAQSCEKVGGYVYGTSSSETFSTWSPELGYGRINMLNAVQQALLITPVPPDITISSLSVNSTSLMAGQLITISASQFTSNPAGTAISPILEYRWSVDQNWSNDDLLIGTNVSSLGNGIGSEAEVKTYVVPDGVGTRYILIKCDATSLVTESDEANNIGVISVLVGSISVLPDVTITSFNVTPNAPIVGQTVTIGCVQSIINPGPTTSAISVEYRFSNDAIWSSDDTVIGTDVSIIGISPSSEIEEITFVIPNSTGTKYVLVRADVLNGVIESNENNNTFALAINVFPAPVLPDVTLSNINTSAINVIAGQSVSISCLQSITIPPTAQTQVVVEFRWSNDAIWSSNDYSFGTSTTALGGTSISGNAIKTFSVPTGTGTYYALIMADATSVITESNESNVWSMAFLVSAAANLPDVFIDAISISATTAMAGDVITVSCNQNTSVSSGLNVNVFMEYRWATGTLFSTTFPIIGVDYSSLGAGDFFDDEALVFTVPAGTGQRYIMLRCDSNNNVVESNESNNIYVIPIMVIAPAAPTILENQEGEKGNPVVIESATPTDLQDYSSGIDVLLMTAYPNPAKDQIQIRLNSTLNERSYYSIRNMVGQLVLSGVINAGNSNIVLDVHDLPSGIYIFTLQKGSETLTERIVVEK